MDVLRYVLAVEFTKVAAPPFDPYGETDQRALLEALPQYHDGPRNSPNHLYAALADDQLVWHRAEVPVSQLIRGPGTTSEESQVAVQAEGFVDRFARLVHARYSGSECFRSCFRDVPIEHPWIPCVLVDYLTATPWLPEPKRDFGQVYRVLDGYHRAFQMVLRGRPTISAFAGRRETGAVWEGNYGHLARFESGRWVPRETTNNCMHPTRFAGG